MTKQEEAFTKELLARTQKALALGANGKRFLTQLEKEGGVRVMQNLIKRQQVSELFEDLEKSGNLKLSPEAAVTESVYGALFTDDEVNWCFQQLCDSGYFR